MSAKKCLVCGSTSLRADRALSGRLVCNSCGAPLGVRKRRKKKMYNSYDFSSTKKYILFLIVFIFVLLLVVV